MVTVVLMSWWKWKLVRIEMSDILYVFVFRKTWKGMKIQAVMWRDRVVRLDW
jgi:hypothetical protein